MLGSKQTNKRVKQKCLHFYFRATGLVLVQWSHKWSRFTRLTHLSSNKVSGNSHPRGGEDLSKFKRPLTGSRVTKMGHCHSGTERSGVIESIIFCIDPIESSRLSRMTEALTALSSIVYRLSSNSAGRICKLL